ncbi:MAG: hypothetical protein ACPG6B_03235 [Oceanihabitans sp.]
MKKLLIIFLIYISFTKADAQEYELINQIITPFEEDNPISVDSIYLNNKFIPLGKEYLKVENLNEETIRFWWNNSSYKAPVELFLKNFNLSHLKSELLKTKNDSIIDFKKLNTYFIKIDKEFTKNNPKKKYLSISQPFFNCQKNWCFIVKSEFIPYTYTGGNKLMYIYVKVDNIWILYSILNLSVS